MFPLLDALVDDTPAPLVDKSEEEFRLLVTMMESDDSVHLGKVLLTGKVISGVGVVNDRVKVLKYVSDGDDVPGDESTQIVKILKRDGLSRRELNECKSGDIVNISWSNWRKSRRYNMFIRCK